MFAVREVHLLQLWLAGVFGRDGLRTEEGRRLQIDFPGIPTTHGGPDLRSARLQFDGVPVVGDVELHLWSAGWKEHQHGSDETYRSVILHACLWRSPAEFHDTSIPEVILAPYLRESLWETLQKLTPFESNPEISPDILVKRAQQRLAERANRFRHLLTRNSPDEVLYAALLTALGWTRNKAGFVQLAHQIPFSRARQPKGEQELQAFAARIPWCRNGIRPANQPQHRLGKFIPLIAACATEGIVRTFNHLLQKQVPAKTPQEAARQSRTLADPMGQGPDRGVRMVLNVLVPFFSAVQRHAHVLESLVSLHPAAESCRIVERTLSAPSRWQDELGALEIFRETLAGVDATSYNSSIAPLNSNFDR